MNFHNLCFQCLSLGVKSCTTNIDALNCVLGAGDLSWLSLHYSSKSIMQKLRIIVETSLTDQATNVVEWILFSSVIPYCKFLCDGFKAISYQEKVGV